MCVVKFVEERKYNDMQKIFFRYFEESNKPDKSLDSNNDDKNNDHNLRTTFLQRKNHHLSSV